MITACRQHTHKAMHVNAYMYEYFGCAFACCSGISAYFDELKPKYYPWSTAECMWHKRVRERDRQTARGRKTKRGIENGI